MAHSVFISHSSKDKVIADAVCHALEAAGVRCWIAPRNVLPGDIFEEAIMQAIDDCRVVVLTFSASANLSDPVFREVSHGFNQGKRVLPFRVEDVKPARRFLFYLGSVQWLDAFPNHHATYLDHLVAAVKRNLAIKVRLPQEHRRTAPEVPTKPPRQTAKQDGAQSSRGSRADALPAIDLRIPGTKVGDTVVNPIDGTEFVWVPGGDFTMGTDSIPSGWRSILPKAHPVFLGGFWIAKNDVTWGQYKEFCAETKRSWPAPPSWGIQDDHPVVNVSYQDAADYAKWAGCQLPTEEQWEKAARGTDGREYPWGNDWDASKCRCNADSTSPVGSFPSGASPFGCLDMAGNVWEWTSSWWNTKRKHFVGRGGSWLFTIPGLMRCAYRFDIRPTYRYSHLGFRVAGPVLP
jgi:formylglycine-generating enzyme required for sulfatase activity